VCGVQTQETEVLLLQLLSLFDSAAEAHIEWVQTLVLEVLLQFNQTPPLLWYSYLKRARSLAHCLLLVVCIFVLKS
jgi:hypothetical protein